ncbi:MAG: HlyD family efflux transporter periplasmic adaptor subunit [Deltaproteobacteria bacterium]|nr:HlyD family efflux transporter periplasmic adaptor subunit [Deltaproteobacteria bacterium]
MAQSTESGRPQWLGIVQLAAILLVIVIALYFARAPSRVALDATPDLTAEKGKPTVSVIQPKPTTQALTVRLTGSVRIEVQARVMSEVTGRVVWISPKFSNGGSIPANETFIKIDTAEHELRLERAEMAVKAAEARVWVEKAGGEEDAQEFLRANPGAEVSDSVRRLPSIAEMEAELAQARAALKLAKLRLEQTNISLPYDSRVMATELEVGEFVGPARSVSGRAGRLGTVYRTDAIRVRVPVDPKDLAYLSPVIGRSARVRTQLGAYDATVERVSATVAPSTRLAGLFLKFSDDVPKETLPLPGMFADIRIAGPSYENVYVLPESVLQEGGSVWVVEKGALTSVVPKTLGRTDAGWVVEAFDAGEGVVVGAPPGARKGLAVATATAK